MPEQIIDGTGNNTRAKVDSDNRVWVNSKSSSIQHTISETTHEAYQVKATVVLSSGVTNVLHLKNISTTKQATITYLRHQVIGATGGTAFPNVSNYFRVCAGETYSSGGTEVIPVNMYLGHGNTAPLTVYKEATLSGTLVELDRWYTRSDGDMYLYNKEGALIIPPNETICIAYVGDQTGGSVFARVSFIMEEI